MKPSGIETATFRLVAQCLNQLRYAVPTPYYYSYRIKEDVLGVTPVRYAGEEMRVLFWWGNRKDRDHFQDTALMAA
jgi:hypothetical protein